MTFGIVDLILRMSHGLLDISGSDGIVSLVVGHIRVKMSPRTVGYGPAFAAFVPAALYLIGSSGASPQKTFGKSSLCH
jgi:hypothetical protein